MADSAETNDKPQPAARPQVPVAVGKRGIEIGSLDELYRFSQMIATSDLAPKGYQGKPANVAVAIQCGFEIGLAPLQAIQNIAVIGGRPTLWGDAVLGLVEASGQLEDIEETLTGVIPVDLKACPDDVVATCTVTRKGRSKPHTVTFSVADAKRAGLWLKEGPWRQYPQRMLQFRARGFALRDVFPHILRGIGIAEEVRDEINITPPPGEGETPQPTTRTASIVATLAKQADSGEPVEVVAEETGEVVEEIDPAVEPPLFK